MQRLGLYISSSKMHTSDSICLMPHRAVRREADVGALAGAQAVVGEARGVRYWEDGRSQSFRSGADIGDSLFGSRSAVRKADRKLTVPSSLHLEDFAYAISNSRLAATAIARKERARRALDFLSVLLRGARRCAGRPRARAGGIRCVHDGVAAHAGEARIEDLGVATFCASTAGSTIENIIRFC